MIDNKQKLLDAAERPLAEQGCGAISSRQIVADAEVNLAAIHYHFGLDEKACPWTRIYLLTIGLDHGRRSAIRPISASVHPVAISRRNVKTVRHCP